jgi:hypothetical protein
LSPAFDVLMNQSNIGKIKTKKVSAGKLARCSKQTQMKLYTFNCNLELL